MISPPILSVLVTVYNRQEYLPATLASILASSFEALEVIVVDDQSSDDSLAIAHAAAQADPRVRVESNENNLGDYGNRKRAASLARGEFIKYVDSDDLIYPHSLAIMVEAMQAYPDAVLGVSHSMPEDEQPYPWRLEPEEAYRKHFLGRGCLNCGPTGAIIRRDTFEATGGFDPTWGVLSDTELWMRLAAENSVVLLPPGLVWWRRHDGQEFTKDDAEEVYLDRGHTLDMKSLQSDNCPLNQSDRETALARKRQHHARRILSLAVKQRSPKAALRLYRKSELSPADLIRGVSRYQ